MNSLKIWLKLKACILFPQNCVDGGRQRNLIYSEQLELFSAVGYVLL